MFVGRKTHAHERQVVKNFLHSVGVFPHSERRHLAKYLLLAFRVLAKFSKPDCVDPGDERMLGLEIETGLGLVHVRNHVLSLSSLAAKKISNLPPIFLNLAMK